MNSPKTWAKAWYTDWIPPKEGCPGLCFLFAELDFSDSVPLSQEITLPQIFDYKHYQTGDMAWNPAAPAFPVMLEHCDLCLSQVETKFNLAHYISGRKIDFHNVSVGGTKTLFMFLVEVEDEYKTLDKKVSVYYRKW